MRDYWSFPAVMRSFKATGYGRIETIGGLEWRVRGGDYVLLSTPSGKVTIPDGANRKRIRSMTWCNTIATSVPMKKDKLCWHADPNWDVDSNSLQRVLRKAEREGVRAERETSRAELEELLSAWIADKKAHAPSTMVVRGHYAAMIRDDGFQFIGFRQQGELIGAIGYTTEDGAGAITFAKHRYGPWWLSKYIWAFSLVSLLSECPRGVNCGDTADRLKRSLGLTSRRQYRVDFSQVG